MIHNKRRHQSSLKVISFGEFPSRNPPRVFRRAPHCAREQECALPAGRIRFPLIAPSEYAVTAHGSPLENSSPVPQVECTNSLTVMGGGGGVGDNRDHLNL